MLIFLGHFLRKDQIDDILLGIVHRKHRPHKDGLLLQVKTGEGKSSIIAVEAAVWALFGERSYIITSNRILAEKDVIEFGKFYAMLGISVDHNIVQAGHNLKKAYECDIVYGQLYDFLSHTVEDEFSGNVKICFYFYSNKSAYKLINAITFRIFAGKSRSNA